MEIAGAAGKIERESESSGLDQTNTRPVNYSARTQYATVTSGPQSLIE